MASPYRTATSATPRSARARVDHGGGAELTGKLELLLDDVDGDDIGPRDPRVLDCKVTKAADVEDCDDVGCPGRREPDGVVGGNTGAAAALLPRGSTASGTLTT